MIKNILYAAAATKVDGHQWTNDFAVTIAMRRASKPKTFINHRSRKSCRQICCHILDIFLRSTFFQNLPSESASLPSPAYKYMSGWQVYYDYLVYVALLYGEFIYADALNSFKRQRTIVSLQVHRVDFLDRIPANAQKGCRILQRHTPQQIYNVCRKTMRVGTAADRKRNILLPVIATAVFPALVALYLQDP